MRKLQLQAGTKTITKKPVPFVTFFTHATHVEEGPIGRTLLLFAVPVLLTQLLQELYSITDCAVIGRFGGDYALAATAVSGLVLSVFINFFIGFSSGISAITGRLFGAYDYDRLRRTLNSVFRFVIIAGIIFTAAGLILAEPFLVLLRCPAEVLPKAALYLRICLIALTAQMIYNVGCAILRSLGDTATPLLLFAFSVVINLIGDLLLVAVLRLSVIGAAAATAFSQWFLALLILRTMIKGHSDKSLCLRLTGKGIPAHEFRHLLGLGIPAGMQALFMSISSLLIQVNINSFGPDAMAGMTVFAKVESFVYLPSFAYGIALTGFVGQNLGAKKPERIRRGVRISLITMSAVIFPLSFALTAASPVLLRLFTQNADILSNARTAVFCVLPFYTVYAVNQVFLGAIKGLGNTTLPMLSTFLCYSIFRVLFCHFLIPVIPSMQVIYASYVISFFLMLFIVLPAYRVMLRRICHPSATTNAVA